MFFKKNIFSSFFHNNYGDCMKKIIFFLFLFCICSCGSIKYMADLSNMSIDEIKEYCISNNLNLIVENVYSDIPKGEFVSQSINFGDVIVSDNLIVRFSSGVNPSLYREYSVNELGRIPVMMYHGIYDESSKYIGGNIDVDGYQRSVDAFINDLEFFYNSGYRIIRLNDYINGIIDVPLGYSPIVLTFDDGIRNNFNVLGVDDNGELIIDPRCAVGILEQFKKKYTDFNVTATFFLNSSLFEQVEYNDEILKWLIDHGYDIGNHSLNHVDFSSIDSLTTVNEIGGMYALLDSIIGDNFVNIVALPFGSPYDFNHENFSHILNGNFNGYEYITTSTLRVGWESDYSPFSKKFNSKFIKRIRAYDNNGVDFDIKYIFDLLKNERYISDGDKNLIVFPSDLVDDYNEFSSNYMLY